MILKYKIHYILLLVLFLFSCNSITLKDITTQEGVYIYKNNKKPVNGKVTDYFENGKLSCEANFKNGIIGDFISYGFQREIIGTSKYSTFISKNDRIKQENNIIRLAISNSTEGNYEFVNLFVVFKQQSKLNYELLGNQLLGLVKNNGFDSEKIETIYFCLGELEPPFYEVKTKDIKK